MSPTFSYLPSHYRGPVLAVAVGTNSEYCYSGGADARIHSWKIPDLNMDPYDGYGEDNPVAYMLLHMSLSYTSSQESPELCAFHQ